jgi:acetyl esterase/lipase
VHGGCYVLNPHEAALPEAVLLAGFGQMKVIAVDYRMPPDAYFPAALDDAMTVYKAAVKMTDPKKIAVFGSSAGGALTLEMMLRAKQEGLPLPGAIAPGTPMSDVTKVGDSFQTNALVDNVLVSPDGFCDAATRFYAQDHDLHDPMLSPIYGDMNGFPPTILTTGTRDLLLSNTVRVHRKLRQAGVDAVLQVFEGQSHAQFYRDDRVPEVKEAFQEIAGFFDRHLGQQRSQTPVNFSSPYPFTEAGNKEFNCLLWMPPNENRAGDIVLVDSTHFTTLFGGTDSLQNFWRISRRCDERVARARVQPRRAQFEASGIGRRNDLRVRRSAFQGLLARFERPLLCAFLP